MDPINYTSAFADLKSPTESFMQGVQGGAGLQQLQLQQQQAQLAVQQKAQMQADLQALAANPTTQAIGQMSIKYPQLSEQFKRSFDILAPAQQQAKLDHATQVYAALHNGEPKVAQKILTDQATALRNSGNEQDAGAAETMAKLIDAHPEFAQTTAGLMISSAMGPDKFAAAFPAIGKEGRDEKQASADLTIKQAEARKAAAAATVAEATVPALIQKPVEDNLTAQNTRKIADLNIQIDQANSETRRGQLVLERDKLIAEQALKGQEQGQGAQAQIDSAQLALDNIKSLRAHPLMKDSAGNSIAGIGSVLGQMLGNVPGTENMDFRGQLESLKSQVFLPAVQQVKGMGSLSNAEGEKLTASVAAINPNMSKAALNNALGVVEKYMTKGLQKGLATKSVPVAGGGFVVNHPTFGRVNEGDINRLMKQYPGATREQVMSYLTTTGAK